MRKISDSSERKIGAILSYAQIALSSLITLLYTPFMLRVLGQSEYGLYGTVNSFVGLLGLLNLGFSASYIRFYSLYKSKNEEEKIHSFNAMFTTVFAVIALLSIIIGGFFSFHLKLVFDQGLNSDELVKARTMMLLLTLSTGFNFLVTVFGCFIYANQKFVLTKTIGLISSVLTFSSNVAVLKLGNGAIGLVVVSVVITTCVQIFYIIYSYKALHFRFDFRHMEKRVFKDVLMFSGLIAINIFVDKVNSGIDAIILGRYCGTAVVAVYTVGASLNSHFLGFSTAISGVFTPRVHELVNAYEMDSKEQRNALTAFFVKVGRIQYLLMALLASGVVFFGKPFIRIWAGEGYEEAYYIALVMILPSIVPLTQNVGIEIQRAENRHHYRSYIYGAMAILNLIISVYLAKRIGALGAAIGTGIACILSTIIIMNVIYQKKINIDVAVYWKNIGGQTLGMIIPFTVGFVIMKFAVISDVFSLVLWITIYSVIYVVFAWFFSTNQSERELLLSPIKKILHRS